MHLLKRSEVRLPMMLVAIASTVLAAYVANSPRLDRFHDSPTYELLSHGFPQSFVASRRVPGYPLLIALSSSLPGGEEPWLILLQALLIVASVLATYWMARAALGYTWMAFLVATLIATDILMAGYVRVVMSETLAVFLTLAMTLAIVRFVVTLKPVDLWVAAGLL